MVPARAARTLLGLLLFALLCGTTEQAHAEGVSPTPVYLTTLQTEAHSDGLARSRNWQVLMHYHDNLLGRWVSEVDGPAFFNAPDGKKNPQAELAATLAAFFEPPATPPLQASGMAPEEHPQCRFSARYLWLKQQLDFDPERLPEQPCNRRDKWLKGTNTKRLVIVFPSAYLNNPASMYGHTFLRLDNPDKPSLLDYAINYAAIVDENKGFLYAIRGIFGQYEGHFNVMPYYAKVQEYGEYENRDIWEYPLNLTPAQVRRLQLHLWELKATYFDYFFFKENCSYHLLSLLEVADPSLHFTDQFHIYTIPTDTLRLLVNTPNLVNGWHYRPARSSIIQHRRSMLSKEERKLARQLADGQHVANAPPPNMDEQRWGMLLDQADDYLLYRKANASGDRLGQPDQIIRSSLLTARSRISASPTPLKVPSPATAPHEGHRSGRIKLSHGRRFGGAYTGLEFRAAYHDLLDPSAGYPPTNRLIFFDAEARQYHSKGRTALSRLTVLDIFSLYPRDPFFKQLSWRVQLGWRPLDDPTCATCGGANLNLGVGTAFKTRLPATELIYVLLQMDNLYSGHLRHDHALGYGAEAGWLLQPLETWKINLLARYTLYVRGQTMQTYRFSARSSLSLRRNLVLSGEWTALSFLDETGYESKAALRFYF